MSNCAICNEELRFRNKPVGSVGKIADGELCLTCFKKVTKNKALISKLKNISTEEIRTLLSSPEIPSDSQKKMKEEKKVENITSSTNTTPPPVTCPKCGSTQIAANKKGKKVDISCLSCGHNWQPKKNKPVSKGSTFLGLVIIVVILFYIFKSDEKKDPNSSTEQNKNKIENKTTQIQEQKSSISSDIQKISKEQTESIKNFTEKLSAYCTETEILKSEIATYLNEWREANYSPTRTVRTKIIELGNKIVSKSNDNSELVNGQLIPSNIPNEISKTLEDYRSQILEAIKWGALRIQKWVEFAISTDQKILKDIESYGGNEQASLLICLTSLKIIDNFLAKNSSGTTSENKSEQKLIENQKSSPQINNVLFVGSINNKYEITMTLQIKPDNSVEGNYYYNNKKTPINLNGSISGIKIVLKSSDPSITDSFEGDYSTTSINGNWTNGTNTFPFRVDKIK